MKFYSNAGYICVCVCVCVCVRVHIMYVFVHVLVCVRACNPLCMYVCDQGRSQEGTPNRMLPRTAIIY